MSYRGVMAADQSTTTAPEGTSSAWRWSNVPVPEGFLVHMGLGLGLEHWHPFPLGFRGSRPVGCALLLAGTALAVGATRAAGDVDLSHPSRLVATGPYRVSRHPMYVAWSLAYLGLTLVAATAWPVLRGAGAPGPGTTAAPSARVEDGAAT